MNFINTNTQIRPCIISKVKFALGLKTSMPLQNLPQKCSRDYWIRSIDTVCILNSIINRVTRQNAIARFEELINN